MPQFQHQKNKVKLSDYNYREDITHRLFLADLSPFDAQVLNEILDLSIQFPLSQLAQLVDTSIPTLTPVIQKLSQSQLLKQIGETIVVDKELRKYYELQMGKFDDAQVPGFDFLFAALRKVPIQVLPDWYAIPRSTNDILQSIADQYLRTPKIYQRHLAELQLMQSTTTAILQDVFQSPNLKVRAEVLRRKYALSRESFEEILLDLEFNFACCLSYNQIGEQWEEVVTPFREWRDYLLACRERQSRPIAASPSVRTHRDPEFSFVNDLSALLKAAAQAPLSIDLAAVVTWLPELGKGFYREPNVYLNTLFARLSYLGLAEVRNGQMIPTYGARDWLRLSPQDQALTLYRIPAKDYGIASSISTLISDRTQRDIERELRAVMGKGWIPLESFIQSLTISLGNAAPVTLKQTGKRWRYEIPQYAETDLAAIRWVLWQRLFEAGMVNTGMQGNVACFCMLPFGQMTLGN
jgi:hypothetical protein